MKLEEYKQLFLSEAGEIIDGLNHALIGLEKDPENPALLREVFRLSHTFKSMAQSMGYEEITKLTHSMENALAVVRSDTQIADKEIVGLLFESVDTLSDLTENLQEDASRRIETEPLIHRFKAITHGAADDSGELKKDKPREKKRPSLSKDEVQTVRIPLARLDSLMELAGELVINRIRLDQIARTIDDPVLNEVVSQMSKLTSRLQEQMMETRLVPLDYIFAPYARLVRDMAVSQEKMVDLIIEGGQIGMDRSIQDEINETLLHILKNAVTHGIESPEEREGKKKPRRGKIKLVARRKRSFVDIELSDDGRGISVKEISDFAIKKGIVTMKELSSLSREDVVMLITSHGYSKAKKVTEAAGRGVGLNAARVKVESYGGTFNIDTRPDAGTTFTIRLPMTLAIVQTMLVGIGDETYCIPLSFIMEAIKVPKQEIKTMEGKEVISHRDGVLPLIRLRETLGFSSSKFEAANTTNRRGNRGISVVIVETGSRRAGLAVDRLLGQQDTVIKPLSGILAAIRGASGATILETGKVALVVDVGSLLGSGEYDGNK